MFVHRIRLVAAALGLLAAAVPARAQGPATPESRLRELGLQLPPVATPLASYVPAVRTGNLVFLSGQGPISAGRPTITGKVGGTVTEEQGRGAAREAALNLLAALRAEIGSLDRVQRVVKLVGFVSSAPGFNRQPWVVNGASDLMVAVFGDAGKHARSSVGVAELPLDIPVEIELVVEIKPDSARP